MSNPGILMLVKTSLSSQSASLGLGADHRQRSPCSNSNHKRRVRSSTAREHLCGGWDGSGRASDATRASNVLVRRTFIAETLLMLMGRYDMELQTESRPRPPRMKGQTMMG